METVELYYPEDITVYEDVRPHGISYTVYEGNTHRGEYLGDDPIVTGLISIGCKVVRCEWDA